jgi:pyruvate/2-oxoacid:ferredoxin oxidoreductase alpha subunit
MNLAKSGALPALLEGGNLFREEANAPGYFDPWERASRLSEKYGYVFLEDEDLRLIRNEFEDRKIVSVGAGKGYVEQQLHENGFDVVACDIKVESEKNFFEQVQQIEPGDFGFAERHADRVLLLSAPDEGRPYASETLRRYLEAGGDAVIYIKFFNPFPPEAFSELLREFSAVATRQQPMNLSTFNGIRGCVPTKVQLLRKRERD